MEHPKVTGGEENTEAMFLGSSRYNVQVFDREERIRALEPIEGEIGRGKIVKEDMKKKKKQKKTIFIILTMSCLRC